MGKLYVVGDIHGMDNKLNKLIKQIEEDYTEDDCIVFLGDYVDRGDNSLEVLQTLISVKEKYNTINLKGNHDKMFYDTVNYFKEFNPNTIIGNMAEYNYNIKVLREHHINTVSSFINGLGNKEDEELLNKINREGVSVELSIEEVINLVSKVKQLFNTIYEKYVEEIEFLNNLCLAIESDKYIISHSGGNKVKGLLNNTEEDWLWSRDFVKSRDTDKFFIVGHTPTQSNQVEVKDSINHILVDTGAVFDNCDIGFYKTEYEYLNILK